MTYEEQLSAAKHRAERDQARQEAKGLREELETAEAEYRRHRANLDARYEKKADESRRRGQAMHGMSRLIRERNEEIKALKERIADMEPRLMPEGMEWPRFEDGEPVRVGDEFMGKDGKTYTVQQVQFIGKCFSLYDFCDRKAQFNAFYGERVKRPAPKVLDADGAEIREKCDVWWVCEGDERGVHAERLRVETICPNGLIECSPYNGGTWVYLEPSELYVNKPVPSSDGRPLREGDEVWDKSSGDRLTVGAIEDGGHTIICRYADIGDSAIPTHGSWSPCDLTHERPDSWERWREEWMWPPVKYCKLVLGVEYDHDLQLNDAFDAQGDDLIRRAKALAEVSE